MRRSCARCATRAPRSSSSPTSCARSGRSPTGSPSSAAARSSARPSPTATSAELASLMVGRPVKLTDREGRRASRARRSSRSNDLRGHRPDRARSPSTASASQVRGGEIFALAGVQGNGQTELTEALLGLEHVRGPDRHARRPRRHPRRASTTCSSSASATCPRTGCTTAWSAASPSPRTSSSTSTTGAPFAKGMSLDLAAIGRTPTERVEEFDVRTPSIERRRVDRSPAATSRRSSWPASCPARSAAGRGPAHPRPRRRLDGVRPQAHRRRARQRRRGHRWSRPSSTRCSGSPTGSASCTAARSSARCPAGTSAEEIGLLMAGDRAASTSRPARCAAGSTPSRPGTGERRRRRERPGRRPAAGPQAAATPAVRTRAALGCCERRHGGQRRRRDLARVRRRAGARRRPDRDRRPGARRHAAQYFFPYPWRHLPVRLHRDLEGATSRCSRARSSTPHGRRTARSPAYVGPLSETLTNATPLILGRPLGGAWPSAPACSTSAARARSSWARSSPGSSASPGTCPPVLHLLVALIAGIARWRALGRPRRPAQGQDRRARGDHDDHAQLHRALLPGVPAVGPGLPGARRTARRSPTRSTPSARLPAAARRHACGCTSA